MGGYTRLCREEGIPGYAGGGYTWVCHPVYMPGMYTLVYPTLYIPGYTLHTLASSTQYPPSCRGDRLAALTRSVTETNISDGRVTVVPLGHS